MCDQPPKKRAKHPTPPVWLVLGHHCAPGRVATRALRSAGRHVIGLDRPEELGEALAAHPAAQGLITTFPGEQLVPAGLKLIQLVTRPGSEPRPGATVLVMGTELLLPGAPGTGLQAEQFYVSRGEISFEMADAEQPEVLAYKTLRGSMPEVLHVPPGNIHTLWNPSATQDAVVVIATTQRYIPNSAPDTYYVKK